MIEMEKRTKADCDRTVQRRVRGAIIEYLELVSSFDEQREYQRRVPAVNVPTELIVQWQDWVGEDPGTFDWHPTVFSADELKVLWAFHHTWDRVAASTPDPLPGIEEMQRLPAWRELRQAAKTCLDVLANPGHAGGGMKQVVVPLDAAAMERLDMDEATDDELVVLRLEPDDFSSLWKIGAVQALNEELEILIDDYEDESIQGVEKLKMADRVIADCLEANPNAAVLAKLRELLRVAIARNTGIFFYF